MASQMTPRKYFRNYIGVTVALFIAATALTLTKETLDGSLVYEGVIDEIRIASVNTGLTSRKINQVVYFTMKGLDAKLGVFQNFDSYADLLANLKSGTKAKIYYDKSIVTTTEV